MTSDSDKATDEKSDVELPANPERYDIGPQVRLEAAGDTMEEFNRVLFQVAKAIWFTALILLAVFVVFMAYVLAQLGFQVLA